MSELSPWFDPPPPLTSSTMHSGGDPLPWGDGRPYPRVSALMVTRDRLALMRRAVACLRDQTWPNLELVVADDGSQDLTPAFDELGLRKDSLPVIYKRLPAEGKKVGTLRNLTLDLATGEYLVQWDDDDWYHPGRIEEQMRWLARGYDACCLEWTLMHLDAPGFVDKPYRAQIVGGTPGTILHRRDPNIRYPDGELGEDTVYLDLWRQRRYACLAQSASHLFIRCHHGANSWHMGHFLRRLRNTPGSWMYYVWARFVRGDITTHPFFELNARERESTEMFLAQSRAMGLFTG